MQEGAGGIAARPHAVRKTSGYNRGEMTTATATISQRVPPGPRGWLGNSIGLARDWGGYLAKCQREYGDVVYMRFLGAPVCFVGHPEGIESVLVRNAANFLKSKDYVALKTVLGNGLLTSEGRVWQRERQLIQPAFRHESIAKYAEIMEEKTEARMERWRAGEVRDMHREMGELTLEIVARALFGAEIQRDPRELGQAIGTVMEQFLWQALVSFALPEGWRLPKGPGLKRSMKHLDEVIYAILHERRRSGSAAQDLLQTLIEARDEQGQAMSDEQLRDEIMTLFLAGHETTANALTWTWYLLAQHPEADERLGAELKSALSGKAPTAGDLARLPYTEMVIKESMRLYPPAWGIGRRAIEGCELGEYWIPKGTNVFLMQWITHRDERFFPDPERFDPERWRDDPVRSGRIPRFAYFPFGGGPRVCLGAGFAMMEAVLLLATIAQRYRFTLANSEKVEPLFTVTLRPKRGVRMMIQARN